MHVAPADLRTVERDGIVVRFATLGPLAFVVAEIPASGAAGTSLERPCRDPHWGFVIDGRLTFVRDGTREVIPAGRAFHVPGGGPDHHFETDGPVSLAGFVPIDPGRDFSDGWLAAHGFEQVTDRTASAIVPLVAPPSIEAGQIQAESVPMSDYVLTRTRVGERTASSSAWCDAPHWGMVTSGRLTFAFEDGAEVVRAGEVFHCPAGPPGHRLEAADHSTMIDLTPIGSFGDSDRISDWRQSAMAAVASTPSGLVIS